MRIQLRRCVIFSFTECFLVFEAVSVCVKGTKAMLSILWAGKNWVGTTS